MQLETGLPFFQLSKSVSAFYCLYLSRVHDYVDFLHLLQRLQLARQVVRSTPRGLRTLIAAYPHHIGWCRAVAEDLAELAADPRCAGLPPPGADPKPWMALLAGPLFVGLLMGLRSPA